jgi:transposase
MPARSPASPNSFPAGIPPPERDRGRRRNGRRHRGTGGLQQVVRSRIEPMKKIASTLRSHRELILNYFRAKKQFSSGVVEGLNNKAKLTMRKAYGFRTFRVTEIALYHALAKLPEPNATHRFY